ncbi:YueI family protein [Jeotgalibacillus soli]|uniref:DUF1694 domain-containing protein n=1 Tax=Jeotgalibacillus soli TaxID=889306 RepID=A0A0C2RD22_9BACL|nr:YueI family protein [Jeotgalibacillus soli]KIL48175.1 hypothetical protein KP78_16220 [Jeotgalibacillus soli]
MSEGKRTVDDYLQDGMYGAKETLPNERRLYLGTIRERVEIVLKQNQVRESTVYPEIEQALKRYPDLHLYLNGNMNYRFLSKYVQLASALGRSYTMVTNKEHNSEFGLVAAHADAAEKEVIEVPKRTAGSEELKSSGGFFSRLFKRNK